MPEATIASQRATYDRLVAKLAQLRALLEMTYGCSGEAFNDMHAHRRDDFLWACAELAEECNQLAVPIGRSVYAAGPDLMTAGLTSAASEELHRRNEH